MKKELVFELSIYVISLILVVALWSRPVILMICCGVISLTILLQWHTNRDIFIYWVAFILGSIAELIAVYFGAWKYTKPSYLIPLWLPFTWGIAGLLIKNISETLLKIGNKQKIE
jgi:uncharacterized membrane protein YoaT (DUF817 family)